MEWTLRKAVPQDEGRIRELFIEMMQSIYPEKEAAGYPEGALNRFFGECEDWICVAESEGKILAFLSMNVHHDPQDYLYLDDLSVGKEYRGQGMGTALIGEAERFARENHLPNLMLHVETSNTRAYSLYTRLGFHIIGTDGTRRRMWREL